MNAVLEIIKLATVDVITVSSCEDDNLSECSLDDD